MNLMELFKSFQSQAFVNKYPPSVRVLYDALLFDFNGKYWPEHCIYSQRGLSEMTGLSQATIHRALAFLAQRGHLTIRVSKNQTTIRLTNHGRISDESPVNHPRITDESPMNHGGRFSITRVREDTDIDTDTSNDGGARARTDCVNVDDPLVELWLKNRGADVSAVLLSTLSMLVNKYGRAQVAKFIESAAANHGGEYKIAPAWLIKHIERLEGGKTRARVVPISQGFKSPDTRFDSEFGL